MSGYQDFVEALQAAGAGVAAAECHGFLCGQLCSPNFPAGEPWQEFLNLRTADYAQVEDCHDRVRLLLEETRRQLWSEEFDFRLLVPDDGADMQERVQALAGWCQGFLYGLGLVEDLPPRVLSDDVQEWLKDVEMIARAGVDEPDADDELALAQVTDHVRTGVMLIMEELRVYCDRSEPEALY